MPDVIIRLDGEFDISNARAIEATAARAREGLATGRIVVDLDEVTFLDAAGIRALLRAQRQAAMAGFALTVRNPSPFINEVLAILGVDDRLLGRAPIAAGMAVERGRRANPGSAGSAAGRRSARRTGRPGPR